MNKATLVAEVVARTGIEKRDVALVVDEVLEVVRGSVAKGERVTLAGFGTFEKRRRAARLGRNPHTGDAVKVPARVVPSFHPGKAFRESVLPRNRKRAATRKRPTRR
ncbi:MAG TPA: HU family DNA-binding protein [Actinomycetota bacterium]